LRVVKRIEFNDKYGPNAVIQNDVYDLLYRGCEVNKKIAISDEKGTEQ